MENKSLLVYAYLGDAVYELLTREYLCFKTGAKAKVNDLKNESLSFVSATSQATILKKLLDLDFFNEQELDLLRRGRNVKTNSKPKYCSIITYKYATSLEVLFGFLKAMGKVERLEEIFAKIIEISEERFMLVYGKNSCEEVLLQNMENVQRVYLDRNFKDKKIISLLEKLKFDPIFYTKYELDELVNANHQGIIVDIRDYVYCDLDEIIKENGLLVMLDHLEDTHNFGAIIRTCEAAGVDGIIIPKDRSVRVNSTVMKTSSGACVNMKIAMVTNLVQTIHYLKDKGYWIVASDMNGIDYTSVDYRSATCLVIGNEGSGISDLVRKSSDYIASIPMKGKINSLNASVAAGVFIYEAVRQRK